ncbi:MAG TPA: Hsp20/alpha crystallin family protein [Gammaproteobacteria bacterium]|nr:Hsp20/alpha crystallin family protein [Gammaproteobacteria bacterium]
MNITRYQPRDFFRDFSDQMNRLMSGRLDTLLLPEETGFAENDWSPAVDIKEETDKFLVCADLPGVETKDIEVSLENGVLTINGKRESEVKDEKDGYRRVERVYGEFHRQFTLPDSADPEKVSAKCEKGVLEIAIGKTEARKPKRISVKAS